MLRLRGFLAACCIIVFCNSSNALTFKEVSNKLVLSGEIKSGDYEFVRKTIISKNIRSVLLNSGGGDVKEALKIATFFREAGVTTHLPKRSVCASACVLLFAGGVIRTADNSSKIGVHVGSGVLNETALELFDEIYSKHGKKGFALIASFAEQNAARFTLEQTFFLLKSGVSLRLLEKTIDVHHLEVLWLSQAEARDFNLINSF